MSATHSFNHLLRVSTLQPHAGTFLTVLLSQRSFTGGTSPIHPMSKPGFKEAQVILLVMGKAGIQIQGIWRFFHCAIKSQ